MTTLVYNETFIANNPGINMKGVNALVDVSGQTARTDAADEAFKSRISLLWGHLLKANVPESSPAREAAIRTILVELNFRPITDPLIKALSTLLINNGITL